MEKKTNSSTRAKRKYNDANYERIVIDARKGVKDNFKRAAESAGMSIAAYVQEAVREKMEREGIEYKEEDSGQ